MGLNKGLAPDMVLVGLDKVFFSKFNKVVAPDTADVLDGMIFKQDKTNKSGIITEVMNDGGTWDSRTELQNLTETQILAGDKRTFTVSAHAQTLPISKHYFDDEAYGTVKESVRKMAQKAWFTDRLNGFGLYRDAFTASLTNGGTAWISDSHTNLIGDTVSNKTTAALSESSLYDAMTALQEQKDQSGDRVGHEPKVLLVPNKLFKIAVEITDSILRSGTADNDTNVYSSKYGLILKQSRFLGANYGGSDTAWFLLSEDHNGTRWERKPVVTDLVDYKYSDNFVYKYKGEFRNVYGAVTYEGLYGSDGTA
jgi:hypothetical protein